MTPTEAFSELKPFTTAAQSISLDCNIWNHQREDESWDTEYRVSIVPGINRVQCSLWQSVTLAEAVEKATRDLQQAKIVAERKEAEEFFAHPETVVTHLIDAPPVSIPL